MNAYKPTVIQTSCKEGFCPVSGGEPVSQKLPDQQPAEPVWKIPVVWEMKGFLYVPRPTLAEAMEAVHNDVENFPLPPDGSFLDGSFDLDCYDEDYIRQCFNNCKPDMA